MNFTISIGIHSNGEEMSVEYEREEIKESWTIREAMDVAILLLHSCSLIREQSLAVQAMAELGVSPMNINFIIEQWDLKRKEMLRREIDEQIYSNDNSHIE